MFIHPVVVLDFETTGLDAAAGDRVTEVAAVRIERGRITHRFETLVNCQRRISRSIANYTHITQEMIDRAPVSAEVFRALIPFIGNDPVFAHNAKFDEAFFAAECNRANVECQSRQFICTLKLAEQVFPGLPGYALSPLAHSLGLITDKPPHRAGHDAELAANVLVKLAQEICARRSLPFLHASMLGEILSHSVPAAA